MYSDMFCPHAGEAFVLGKEQNTCLEAVLEVAKFDGKACVFTF
jgi:hypothetical protein